MTTFGWPKVVFLRGIHCIYAHSNPVILITWERPKIRYKRNSLYPGKMSNEMALFQASKFAISGGFGLSGFVITGDLCLYSKVRSIQSKGKSFFLCFYFRPSQTSSAPLVAVRSIASSSVARAAFSLSFASFIHSQKIASERETHQQWKKAGPPWAKKGSLGIFTL